MFFGLDGGWLPLAAPLDPPMTAFQAGTWSAWAQIHVTVVAFIWIYLRQGLGIQINKQIRNGIPSLYLIYIKFISFSSITYAQPSKLLWATSRPPKAFNMLFRENKLENFGVGNI